MTEDAAFFARIADDPDDDAHRLVFADDLDESGDPAREAWAEFIRGESSRPGATPAGAVKRSVGDCSC